MPTTIADPIPTLEALTRTSWISANTSDITPASHTGAYDRENISPQVCWVDPDDQSLGGESSYSGIMGDGSGPFQRRAGLVFARCYAHRRDGSGVNPKQLVWEFFQEIHRIIHANAGLMAELISVGVQGSTLVTDTTGDPTIYQRAVTVTYTWIKEP